MAHRVLIDGDWREAQGVGTFRAEDPLRMQPLQDEYPVSGWDDCEAALRAAASAAEELRAAPADSIADFLEHYVNKIESIASEICEMAQRETALPLAPRLRDVEMPRTVNQLRAAAAAAVDGGWALPTIDTEAGIRSCFEPLGPVCVLGPNNFPLAFGSMSGGDFAAAIAAGNPVIAKANSSHPGTTRLFAEAALEALVETDLPPATVQLLYRLDHADGERLVADPRLGATAYTGSRAAGLKLKAAADAAGKPIYLELSSVNPVVILPGALAERAEQIAADFTGSCLMGTGQFCTNPGLVVLIRSPQTTAFIEDLQRRFAAAAVGTLLSQGVQNSLRQNLQVLREAGARLLVGSESEPAAGAGYRHANALLQVAGTQFLEQPQRLQTEVFGNCSLLVVADDEQQVTRILDQLEGNLTGCIYSDTQGGDDDLYDQVAPHLIPKVGRILNDKMPTGVAVSSAMNHGGPYPATGHPGFTAVGIPAALRRFGALRCYDNVRPHRLPALLQDDNPTGATWRLIDGQWSQADI